MWQSSSARLTRGGGVHKMKRRNLILIAWLLGIALLAEAIVLLINNPAGHIICATSILIAIAFGIIIGFLSESHEVTTKTKQIVHYRKSDRAVENHLVPEDNNNASDGTTTASNAK